MATSTRITPGIVTLTFTDSGGSSQYAIIGFFTGQSIRSPWGIQTYLAPVLSGGSTVSKPFATRKLTGPGQVKVSGVLATTVSSSDTICDQIDEMTDMVLEDTIYSEMEMEIDYDFDGSSSTNFTLKDVKVVATSITASGNYLQGNFSIHFAWIE